MKITIAIDSFKGSLSSIEAENAAKTGILEVFPDADITLVPIADGGEGTVEALACGMNGELRTVTVTNPLGSPVEAQYGFITSSNTAVIEMASAAGISLVPESLRNPLNTTTYGVGELIRHAVQSGIRKFIIGIGGSATHDCGIGMLQALGYCFSDEKSPVSLTEIKFIDSSSVLPELSECEFEIACDVTNPLCGESGAAAVFAPQKGASAETVRLLDKASFNFALMCEEYLQKNGISGKTDIKNYPGAGAAGGMGFAFLTFMNSRLCRGIDLISEQTGLFEKIKTADLVISGEGQIDSQTSMGKVPAGIAAMCKKYNTPLILISGGCYGVTNIDGAPCFSVMRRPMTLDEAMEKSAAQKNISETASAIMRVIKIITTN